MHAQNALLTQSAEDRSGKSHENGWGVVTYEDGKPHLQRQAWAAYHGEHFKRAAAKVYSQTVLAHVRRATVGEPALENTHPFTSGDWSFAHNGTVPGFKQMRPELLDLIAPARRAGIEGETDSEHVFAYLLTLIDNASVVHLPALLRDVTGTIAELAGKHAPGKRIALNMMITDGEKLAGTRIGRTLHYVERKGVYDCEICGFPHIHHDPKATYWASVFASEPITHEDWQGVPNNSVWAASAQDQTIEIEPI